MTFGKTKDRRRKAAKKPCGPNTYVQDAIGRSDGMPPTDTESCALNAPLEAGACCEAKTHPYRGLIRQMV